MPRKISWFTGGILMALLILFTFSIWGADRPIGASTYVPYFAGLIFGLDPEQYEYMKEIEAAGAWEGVMLIGAFLGGLFMSVFVTKTFRFSVLPALWKERKNHSVASRLFWSFTAGFVMIIGARLAGGCTSGHFLSGASQIAVSGLIFGGITMATVIVTGRLFYKKKGE
ncbi:YeeE/YedE thiosulfate transporter family protein [Hydrogenimonas sp.]|uniref:YeeE/YedE thiosulfate transporter family protein n=1 Tax=Hydrogenimonas sp. TaxID=2231112 RepID=UPI002635C447|nr:YeeE/YedE thiosulfate transporter family protein [Hydrogenimonas sp.]